MGIIVMGDCSPYSLRVLYDAFYDEIKRSDPNFSVSHLKDADFKKDGWYAFQWSGNETTATSLQRKVKSFDGSYFLRVTATTSSTKTDYTVTLYTLGGEILARSKGDGCFVPLYSEAEGQTTLLKSAIASVIGPGPSLI